ERGINTSLDNAQVITRDKEIEQIDTTLHTDMLNQSTRQQFVIDFLKTATLVPQVAKGIGQEIKDKNYGVLGQLALNMGTNGAKIVIYAKDIKKEINEILKDATVVDGVLSLNMENTTEINNLLKDVLSEFGKSFYDINYVIDKGINNLMAVNDSDGRLAINLAGIGFGNVENLLTGILHEGGHGTYANAIIDEKAVGALTGKIVYDQNKGIILSDEFASKVEQDTVQYFMDRADEKLRDKNHVIYSPYKKVKNEKGYKKEYGFTKQAESKARQLTKENNQETEMYPENTIEEFGSAWKTIKEDPSIDVIAILMGATSCIIN
ncbi:hypothetical protein, partial [Fusobacterium sp. PH5-44]|uniref:hypothetical protein n=1 Tax=unclassified Fusobacterium TaxID=2648384 RepID=UPI003D1B6ABF